MKAVLFALAVASTGAFAPSGVRSTIRVFGATNLKAADAAVDYEAMDVDALEKEIEGARRKLFDMRLEKRQQSKRANFKSSDVRKLKGDVARMMPFYEAKLGGPSPSPLPPPPPPPLFCPLERGRARGGERANPKASGI